MSLAVGVLALVLGAVGGVLFWPAFASPIESGASPLSEKLLLAAVFVAAIGVALAVAGLLKRDFFALLGLAFSLLAVLVVVLPAVVIALWVAFLMNNPFI